MYNTKYTRKKIPNIIIYSYKKFNLNFNFVLKRYILSKDNHHLFCFIYNYFLYLIINKHYCRFNR